MTVMIQDSARNLMHTWPREVIRNGVAVGAYMSPFTSPREAVQYKKAGAQRIAESIKENGGTFVFDAMSHAFGMPRVGDFRYYNGWDLWPTNGLGDFENLQARDFHINRVIEIQDSLSSEKLNPTILLSSPDSNEAALAVRMAEEGVSKRSDSWITIAGTSEFWSAGSSLDALVGQLDQLEPRGWVLAVARENNSLPPNASAREVYGICRTTFALAQNATVHLSYGDIAGLPALAAGASTVGTGWDMRQRICAYNDFIERSDEPTKGRWLYRPLLRGLLGSLKKGEYEILESEYSTLAERLAPGAIPPTTLGRFQHHARGISDIGLELSKLPIEARLSRMVELYDQAVVDWETVQDLTGAKPGASAWIDANREGLELFRRSEGWA